MCAAATQQQEYNLPEVKDRQFLIAVHKKAKKLGFDINRYNQLRDEAYTIESNIRRLRDPIKMRHAQKDGSDAVRPSAAGQTTDQLVEAALATNPNEKKSLADNVTSIFASTMKKFKK